MGGCVSKPKDLNFPPASLPGENSVSGEPTVKEEGETIAQENNNGGENQKEPLVDLSEPNLKDPNTDGDVIDDSKNAVADLVSGLANTSYTDHVTPKQTEENVGAGNETTEQIKDGVDLPGKTDESETHKSDAVDNNQLLNFASSGEKVDSHLASA